MTPRAPRDARTRRVIRTSPAALAQQFAPPGKKEEYIADVKVGFVGSTEAVRDPHGRVIVVRDDRCKTAVTNVSH